MAWTHTPIPVAGLTTRHHLELEDFSARELEVIDLLSHGKSRAEIAEELVISHHTVARHLRNISDKADAHSMHQIVAYAFLDGICHA